VFTHINLAIYQINLAYKNLSTKFSLVALAVGSVAAGTVTTVVAVVAIN
jgi:hypothetical protein